MKKNLFLRLCLILLVAVTAYSCRTEDLHNEEAQQQSQVRLISQRISLSEAKHRSQLLPNLEKAETAIEKKQLNVQGKLVNIGNGITIDTDDVIYIENGPDFHTYTFSVIRDNAPANAPVENVLMTPNTDGSYRVFHIVLNLTEADKAKIGNREFVDFKNREQVTELANMDLSSLSQRTSCTPEYYSYPIPCADANYRHLPGESCQLSGTSGAAYWGTGVFWNCQNLPEPVDHVITPSEGGPGGGGNTNPGTPPDNCNSAATNPEEVGLINENGCNTGLPTETNIRPTQTPCVTIKKSTTDSKYNAHVETLKGKGHLDHEVGYKLSYPVPNSGQNGTQDQIIENHHGTNVLNFSPTNYTFAIVHSHYNNQYPIFSPDDLVSLNLWISGAIAHNSNPNNMPRINLKEITISVVTYRGTYLMSFDGTAIDPYPAYTKIQWKKLNDYYLKFMSDAGNDGDSDYMEKLETEFFKFTNKHMPMPGMKLFKVESTGNTEIYLENGNHKTKECPK